MPARHRSPADPSPKGPVLVLASFALVLVAAALLLAGLAVDSGLTLIYASIGCSLAAGVLLVLTTRAERRGSGPAGTGSPGDEAVPSRAGGGSEAPPVSRPDPPADAPAEAAPSPSPSPEEDYLFPIADYERRPVEEVLPLLDHLYGDELDMVEARERRGAGREEVLRRVRELRRRFPTSSRGRPPGARTPSPADPPIPGYAALRPSEVPAALIPLSVTELDQVRAYEERNGQRPAVLEAIDRRRAALTGSAGGTPTDGPAPGPP